MKRASRSDDHPSTPAPPLQAKNQGANHDQPQPNQVGGSEQDNPARMEEAKRQQAEFGVVGWVENDESSYDHRKLSSMKTQSTARSSSQKSFAQSSSSLISSILLRSTNRKSLSVSFQEFKEGEDSRIEFSTKLYGRDEELAKLEQVYQRAIGIENEEPQQKNEEGNDEEGNEEEAKSRHKNSATKVQTPLQIVLLEGFSGSGKTALVAEAVRRIRRKFLTKNNTSQLIASDSSVSSAKSKSRANIIIHGKYDHLHHIPYKALSLALKRWYRRLSESEKSDFMAVQKDLEETLGSDDAQNLAEILPFMSKLITGYDDHENDASSRASSTRTGRLENYGDDTINKARVQFAFQCLFRSLCRYSEAPLILFLDDLQWADSYSMDLLASLLSPKEANGQAISRLVFIGAYRQNEVTSRLKQLLETLHQNNNNNNNSQDQLQEHSTLVTNNASILSLCIHDLPREQLRDFVADTLQLSTEEVLPLANAIFQKTMGNMYFARQALEDLVRQNALYYDMMTFQWQWAADSEESLAEKLTSDIAEMVRSKIQALPEELQQILVVASYLGDHFDCDILINILNASQDKGGEERKTAASDDVTTLGLLLDLAVKEGLLAQSDDISGRTDYSFAHDRFREVTQAIVMDEESDHDYKQLMINVGHVLVEDSTENDDDGGTIVTDRTSFFLGMHHLNVGTENTTLLGKEAIHLGQLNLQAARESITNAAFESAVDFAKRGIAFVAKKDGGSVSDYASTWQSHRELMHELHQVAAEACRLSGDLASMEAYCKACLAAEKDRPLDDLFQIYFTLANGLIYGSNRLDEAKVILLKLLAHLGCKFPRSTLGKLPSIVKELLVLALFRRRWKPGTIDNMDFVQDFNQLKILKLFQKVGVLSYMTSDQPTLVLTRFLCLKNCLKHGMSIFSAGDVASISIILTGPLNDLQSGKVYAEYGIELMDRTRYKPLESINHFVIYYLGLSWTTPIAECIGPLLAGYQTGINTGMTEHATWCACGAMLLGFQAGQPLSELDGIWMQHLSRIEGWGHISQISMFKAMLRVILAVRGVSRDEIPPLEDFSLEDDVPAVVHEIVSSFDRLEWALLGEHELCADRVVQEKDALMKAAPGNPVVLVDLLFSGVSCWHMYRTTRKNKYGKEAKRIYRILSKWAKQGNPNVLHWIALFDAEKAFIKGRAKVADERYSLAVKLALDSGFKHDAAILYERWGIFTLELSSSDHQPAIGDVSTANATERMQEAVRLHSMWGAFEIVRRLKNRYPALLHNRSSGSL